MIPKSDPFVASQKLRYIPRCPRWKRHMNLKRLWKASVNGVYSHRKFIVASRKSLRLPGMKPELETFEDESFIWPLNIDVENLNSCHPMPCWGKFLHKHCFEGQPLGAGYADTVVTRRKKRTLCDSYMKYLKKPPARKQTTDHIKTRDRSSISTCASSYSVQL